MAEKKKKARFTYNYYDETGRRRTKTFTAGTRAKARKLSEIWEEEYLDGEKHIKITVLDAVNAYIDGKAPVLSPSSVRSYRGIASARIEGRPIANIMVPALTLSDVQKWVNGEVMDNLSPKSVKDHTALLKSALKPYTRRIDWDSLALPQQRKFQGHTPTDAEIRQLLEYTSKQSDPTLYRAILLTAFGPLRRSEVCCIMDTDIHGNAITIDKAMVQDESSAWVIKSTKTMDSTRTIIYPDFVIKEISGIEGRIIDCNPHALVRRFERVLKYTKLPHFRFHDLRHYGASIMMYMEGVSQRTIENRGGWSRNSPVLKRIYQNTMAEKEKAETNIINTYFSQFEVKSEVKGSKNVV